MHFHELIFLFPFEYHWSLFLKSSWDEVSIDSDNGLALTRHKAITLTNVDQIHRRIYAARGEDEIKWWKVIMKFLSQKDILFSVFVFNSTEMVTDIEITTWKYLNVKITNHKLIE